jgi:diaminopimelate epimerase
VTTTGEKLGDHVSARLDFVKGHGTENDFLIVFDPGDQRPLDAKLVTRMCDRRAGIGADGILRAVRHGDRWFMDYRNGDGSIAEMCGNGVRVLARYLADFGHVERAGELVLDTLGGPKHVTFCSDGEISVDMGPGRLGPFAQVEVSTNEGPVSIRNLKARAVDMGNPHAVVLLDDPTPVVDDPTSALSRFELTRQPRYDPADFPDGVNLELVTRIGRHRLAMRVYERGVGETRSCGTGACAVYLAALDASGEQVPYTIDVPGGRLTLGLDEQGHVHLKGPAVLTATGTYFAHALIE